jgi:hypothetical protein
MKWKGKEMEETMIVYEFWQFEKPKPPDPI